MPLAIFEDNEEPKAQEQPAPAVEKKERKPVVTSKPTKFGVQSENAKTIYVFRNGDKHHEGVKMTIHPTKFKTFDQVMSENMKSSFCR